jgi:hypothetical protein
MNIVVLSGYLVLLGIALTVGAYLLYRRWAAGRIVVYIFTKERTFYKRAVIPGSLNELSIDGSTYVYDEKSVFYTPGFLLKEAKPALIFHKDNPTPLDLFSKTRKSGYSSAELGEMMNDSTVRDFVSAQSSLQPKQIMTAIVVMGLAVMGVVITAAYYIVSDGQGFNLVAGTG